MGLHSSTDFALNVLGLFYLNYFTALVVAALWTYAVWQAGLTAVWTQVGLRYSQGVMRATFVATRLRMSSLWIWHNYSVYLAVNGKWSTPTDRDSRLTIHQILQTRPARIDFYF